MFINLKIMLFQKVNYVIIVINQAIGHECVRINKEHRRRDRGMLKIQGLNNLMLILYYKVALHLNIREEKLVVQVKIEIGRKSLVIN